MCFITLNVSRSLLITFSETRCWDVKTKAVTYQILPTVQGIRGMGAYGPTSTLFTLGPNNSIQQYDIEECCMVAEIQLDSYGAAVQPIKGIPISQKEVENSLTSQNLMKHTASVSGSSTPSRQMEFGSETSVVTSVERNLSSASLSNRLPRSATPTPMSTSSRECSRPHRYRTPSVRSNQTGTNFSTGSTLPSIMEVPGYPGDDTASYATSISEISDTRSAPRRYRPNRSTRASSSYSSSNSKEQPIHDLFPHTRERLHNVPYQPPEPLDEKNTTPDELRRHMLRVVFGWDGDIEELIREECKYHYSSVLCFYLILLSSVANHPAGSQHSVLLSRWLGDLDPSLMMSQVSSGFGQNQMNWMLLALTQLGSQAHTKMLGQTFVQQLLTTGDVHAAAAVLLGLGDENDAIEVYVSRHMYLEAILMTCLLMPLEWERQAYLIRQWGEHVVKYFQQHLAIRCFSCIKPGAPEELHSPGVQMANILSGHLAAQSQDCVPDWKSPPPTPAFPGERKAPSLRVLTTFNEKNQNNGLGNNNINGRFPGEGQPGLQTAFVDPSPTTAEFYFRGNADTLDTAVPGDATAVPGDSDDKQFLTAFNPSLLAENERARSESSRTEDDAVTSTAFEEEPPMLNSARYNHNRKGSSKSEVRASEIKSFVEERKKAPSCAGSEGRRRPANLSISINKDNSGPLTAYTPRGLSSRIASPAVTAQSAKSAKSTMSSRSIDRYLNSLDEANSYYQQRPFSAGLGRPRRNTDNNNTRGGDIVVLPTSSSSISVLPPDNGPPSAPIPTMAHKYATTGPIRTDPRETLSLNADSSNRSSSRLCMSEVERVPSRASGRGRSSSNVDGTSLSLPPMTYHDSNDGTKTKLQNSNYSVTSEEGNRKLHSYRPESRQQHERTTGCYQEPSSERGRFHDGSLSQRDPQTAVMPFSMQALAARDLDSYRMPDRRPFVSSPSFAANDTNRGVYTGPSSFQPVRSATPQTINPHPFPLNNQTYFNYDDVIERSRSAPLGPRNLARSFSHHRISSNGFDKSHGASGLQFSSAINEYDEHTLHNDEPELLPQRAYVPPSPIPVPPPPPPPPAPGPDAEKVGLVVGDNRHSTVSAITVNIGIDNNDESFHTAQENEDNDQYILPARAMNDEPSWAPHENFQAPMTIGNMI